MLKKPNAKPLRIGVDARLAFRRGVGTYTANLLLALTKIDRKNLYYLFNAPENLRSGIRDARVHFVDLPFTNAAYYEQVLLPREARKIGLDFLHYVDNSASVWTDFPFVLTLHDTMYQRPLRQVRPHPTLRQRLIHAYKQWAIPSSARKARAILTVSKHSKEQIVEKIGVDPSKIQVTPEGVDLDRFKKTVRKASLLFRILVHGAADERKNLSNVLKTIKLLADQGKKIRLAVIGMDEAELKCTDYLGEAASLGVGHLVDWAGNVPGETLRRVYSESDLFLYPSRWEGFGLPVLEAFACGVPVVTSNSTSLPEVAGDAALLVDPEDPAAIEGAVRQLMEKPLLRKRCIQKGLKRVGKFTWERTAQLTLGVYEQVRAGIE